MTEASAGLKTREAGSAESASPRSWMSAVAARHSSASPSLMRLSSRVQALRFQRAEEPFDDPAAAVEVYDPRRFGKRGRGAVNRRQTIGPSPGGGSISCASTRLSDSCGGSRTRARPRPLWQRPNRRETLAATILTRCPLPRNFLTAAPTTRIGHFTPQLFIMYPNRRAAKSTKSKRRGRSRDVEQGGDEGVAARQLREPICELPRAH
jgi:hypothetical protein